MVDYALDNTNKTGNLTGTWDWTNASTAVTAVAASGDAVNDGLVAGDYIKSSAKLEWYKVATVTDKDNLVLAYAYAEATENGATVEWADISTNDGTSAAKAFVHINEYSTDLARTAGDRLCARRGQTHLVLGTSIAFDEDGTLADWLEVLGDDGTFWAGETGNADPIFDFSTGNKEMLLTSDLYWHFTDIHTKNGTGSHFDLLSSNTLTRLTRVYMEDCGSAYGALYNAGGIAELEDCDFDGCSTGLRFTNSTSVKCWKCRFNDNDLGVYLSGELILDECNFGGVAANTVDFNLLGTMARVIGRDVVLTTGVGSIALGSYVKIMDTDATKNANQAYYNNGTLLRDTGTVRVGGANSAIKVEPLTNCIPNFPLLCYETWVYNAGAEATYTVYMTASGAWGTLPTNTQLWLEAAYFDNAGDAGRSVAVSDDVIAVEGTWAAFDVTCTPNAAGPVRLRVWLNLFSASDFIHIDPLVVVS